ncbi:TolC family protein [Tellurirhabdus bombi]|uniref:TolC family protein n=1 Tax=Tellurirhabdus bombi TaxID=2907205 RepID=UPI001F1912EB|nr:TolC family protein [Tellurirhabdus bombi]
MMSGLLSSIGKRSERPFIPTRLLSNRIWYGKKIGCLGGLLCGFLAFPASAQQLSLAQVLEQSTQNYPFLKAKQAEITSARHRLQAGKTEYLPTIIVQDQYTFSTNNSLSGSFFPNEGTSISTSGGIRPDNIYQGVFGSFTSAVFDWKAINFGRVKANVQVAQADVRRTEADYENELFQHQVRTVDAYLTLLINQKLVAVQRSNLERAQTFKRVVDAGVSSGMRPGVDSALATAEAARARLLLLESQQREQVQRLRLSELTGRVIDSIRVDSMRFYATLPHISPTVDWVSPKNPVLRFYQTQIDLAAARSVAAQRAGLPSISLVGAGWARGSGVANSGDVYRTDLASGVSYQVYNYLFGVAARWNLTHYIRTRSDSKGEAFQLERFRQLANEQNLRLTRQSREADTGFQVAVEQARLAPVQLEAARRAYNQGNARYQNGLTDLPTLLQTLVTLNRAEVDWYVSNGNAWRSLLLKAAAEGDLSLFLNQVK